MAGDVWCSFGTWKDVWVGECVFLQNCPPPPGPPGKGRMRISSQWHKEVELRALEGCVGTTPSLTHYYCLLNSPLNTLHPHPGCRAHLCYVDPSAWGCALPQRRQESMGFLRSAGRHAHQDNLETYSGEIPFVYEVTHILTAWPIKPQANRQNINKKEKQGKKSMMSTTKPNWSQNGPLFPWVTNFEHN